MKPMIELLIGDEIFYIKNANRFISRFCGLMFKKSLDRNAGLLLVPCSSIHMFFMRFAIDAVYLDRSFRVVGKETISPWRIGKLFKGTHAVLELPAGRASGIQIGDLLPLGTEIPPK